MRLVRGGAAALVLSIVAAIPVAAGERNPGPLPITYSRPAAPDCGPSAARGGSQRLWFGAISGSRFDQFWDRRYPYYAEGCFQSERSCRRWLHENLSFMQGGSLNWMRCEPRGPRARRY